MLQLVIADDDRQTRDTIVDFTDWSQHGVEIVGVASDGEEAFRLISELKPDIVILDIEMPGMSGLEVIEKLKDAQQEVSFIIVSSYSRFEYAQRAIHLGVEEYLLKPFLPSEFLTTIYNAAEHIRYLRSLKRKKKEEPPPYQFFDTAHLSFSADVSYPAAGEKALIKELQSGTADTVSQRIEEFVSLVKEQNPELTMQNDCFLICYIELYRFSCQRNIALPQPLPSDADSEDEYTLNRFLSRHLQASCRIVYDALAEQNACPPLIRQAMEYIQQHFTENLSLEIIAQNVYASPCYLSSLFRQSIGQTYIEYLNSVRISKAKEIMQREPHLKNYEIAEQLGYSPKYFAQIFKQMEGLTLRAYRQQIPPQNP